MKQTSTWAGRAILVFAILLAPSAGLGDDGVRSGATAYGDWRDDAPGVWRLITPADLPSPYDLNQPLARHAKITERLPHL